MTTTAKQIETRPDLHIHKDENELMKCCQVHGAIDLSLLEAHGKFVNLGTNGGTRCDVLTGMCACGAWHSKKEPRYLKVQFTNKLRSLFRTMAPDLTAEQNQAVSNLYAEAIKKYLHARPKNRKRVLERYKKKIATMAKRFKK